METVLRGLLPSERKPGQIRPRATRANLNCYLPITVRVNKSASTSHNLTEVCYLYVATGYWISRIIVCKRLHDSGLHAIKLASCIRITSAHRKICLVWFRDNRFWTRNLWETILFTYDYPFNLNTNSLCIFIWRKPETHYLPFNIPENNYKDSRSWGLMVWAGILLDGRIPLTVFGKNSMACVRCRDDILVRYFHLFKDAVGSDSILMDYDAFTNSLVDGEFLENEDIRLMNW